MKFILYILVLFIPLSGLTQIVVDRGKDNVTNLDQRTINGKNLSVPRFADTTAANVQKGVDTSGALFYSYTLKELWLRQHDPKKWVKLVDTSILTYKNNFTSMQLGQVWLGGSSKLIVGTPYYFSTPMGLGSLESVAVFGDSLINAPRNKADVVRIIQNIGYTSTPAGNTSVEALRIYATIANANIVSWLDDIGGKPNHRGIAVSVGSDPYTGAGSGNIPYSAGVYIIWANDAGGLTFDKSSLLSLTYGSTGGVTTKMGIHLAQVADGASNSIAFYNASGTSIQPPTGHWFIYDSVKNRSYLSRLHTDTTVAYTYMRTSQLFADSIKITTNDAGSPYWYLKQYVSGGGTRFGFYQANVGHATKPPAELAMFIGSGNTVTAVGKYINNDGHATGFAWMDRETVTHPFIYGVLSRGGLGALTYNWQPDLAYVGGARDSSIYPYNRVIANFDSTGNFTVYQPTGTFTAKGYSQFDSASVFSKRITTPEITYTGATPTLTLHANAGTGASYSITGNSMTGEITLTIGASPTSSTNAPLFTIDLPIALGAIPLSISFTKNGNIFSVNNLCYDRAASTTTSLQINKGVNISGLGGQVWKIGYHL